MRRSYKPVGARIHYYGGSSGIIIGIVALAMVTAVTIGLSISLGITTTQDRSRMETIESEITNVTVDVVGLLQQFNFQVDLDAKQYINRTNPTEVGQFPQDIAIKDGFLFVAMRSPSLQGNIYIYCLDGNQNNPIEVAEIAGLGNPLRMKLYGDRLYVFNGDNNPNFRIYDISNPADPQYVGGNNVGNFIVKTITRFENYIYGAVSSPPIAVYDVTDETAPVVSSMSGQPYAGNGIRVALAVYHHYLFASRSQDNNGIDVFDLSVSPTLPPLLFTMSNSSSFPTTFCQDLQVYNNFLFCGLQIQDPLDNATVLAFNLDKLHLNQMTEVNRLISPLGVSEDGGFANGGLRVYNEMLFHSTSSGVSIFDIRNIYAENIPEIFLPLPEMGKVPSAPLIYKDRLYISPGPINDGNIDAVLSIPIVSGAPNTTSLTSGTIYTDELEVRNGASIFQANFEGFSEFYGKAHFRNGAIIQSMADIVYTAGTPSDWATSAPTTLGEAIDRLASAYQAVHGAVP